MTIKSKIVKHTPKQKLIAEHAPQIFKTTEARDFYSLYTCIVECTNRNRSEDLSEYTNVRFTDNHIKADLQFDVRTYMIKWNKLVLNIYRLNESELNAAIIAMILTRIASKIKCGTLSGNTLYGKQSVINAVLSRFAINYTIAELYKLIDYVKDTCKYYLQKSMQASVNNAVEEVCVVQIDVDLKQINVITSTGTKKIIELVDFISATRNIAEYVILTNDNCNASDNMTDNITDYTKPIVYCDANIYKEYSYPDAIDMISRLCII